MPSNSMLIDDDGVIEDVVALVFKYQYMPEHGCYRRAFYWNNGTRMNPSLLLQLS
jgi:hypothetical protein